jgi:hypothetical protein
LGGELVGGFTRDLRRRWLKLLVEGRGGAHARA